MEKNERGMYEITCHHCGGKDEYYATSSGYDNCTRCEGRIEVPKKFESGGPAFPIHINDDEIYTGEGSPDGMTMLDYFAAKAMNALLVTDEFSEYIDLSIIAKTAYKQAAAMLEERKKWLKH